MMQNMAAMGRYGDTQMAHVAPGEMVVPGQVLNKNPALKSGIMNAIGQEGINPSQYVVGSPMGNYNPMTGQQEFFFGPFLAGIGSLLGIGGGTSLLASPFVKSAIFSGIGSLLSGNKPKDALRSALIGGALGGIGSNLMPGLFGGAAGAGADNLASGAVAKSLRPMVRPEGLAAKALGSNVAKAAGAAVPAVARDPRLLGIGQALTSVAPGLEGSKLVNLLSTPVGEALAFSLGSKLLSTFDKEEEEEPPRPFGGTFSGSTSTSSDSGTVVRTTLVGGEHDYTDQIFLRLRGRQMSFKISSDTTGVKWRLGFPRLDVRPDGRR